VWQLARKSLSSNDNIRRRKGTTLGLCALCWEVEDNNHIFFSCPLAKFTWSAVRELLGCMWNPTYFAEIFKIMRVQEGQSKRVLWMACTALLWTLWNLRNKFTIDGVFSRQPVGGLYKMSMYLQPCRCGSQWLGGRIARLWSERLAGFAPFTRPSGTASSNPPSMAMYLRWWLRRCWGTRLP
jgi:hypothetical protein